MRRHPTREVMVGSIGVGGSNPIRIQSMTTSDTRDAHATVEQITRLVDAGCEIVRVTVQGKKEAESCEVIRNLLIQKGLDVPLVADIHFYPPAAEMVADFVDKVRINPGNFADRRATFKILEYSDASYQAELDRIEEKFTPLLLKCKKLNRAIRIGTNHGSLSDRIMNRFGDSPEGMVESALEYTHIARKNDFHNIIYSMKSSNPKVMIAAYRLLVARMDALGWDYPLHLGVTEAGAGEEGRVKSAVGIGSLLLDGIGDTIRVSLTEDPWHEIEPCRELIKLPNRWNGSCSEPFDRRVDSEGLVITKLDPKAQVIRDESNWNIGDVPYILLDAPTPTARKFFKHLKKNGIDTPVVLGTKSNSPIHIAAELGSLLVDGMGDGVYLEDETLGLDILQATRIRSSKAEFISCPGCGRTLFDLQEVAARIRAKTEHLKGVKIAIMGCIVNGPGEMADADFGYVGSKPGMIDLYVGKSCTERNIQMKDADEALIALIKKHGKWHESTTL